MRRGWTSDGERSNFSFFFSLKICTSGQSTSLLCQKLSVLFYILTDNAKFTWVKHVSACRMRNWKSEKHRGKTHMGVKKKNTPYFLGFFRKMLTKKGKRAKSKSFHSTSWRSAEHPPTLRVCLMHSLPRCPSCKSCQGSLMCFKTKLCTCLQVNNYFHTAPNLTHGKGQWNDIWALSQSLAYHPGENGSACALWVRKTALGQLGEGKQPSGMHSPDANASRGTIGLLTRQYGVSRHSNAKQLVTLVGFVPSPMNGRLLYTIPQNSHWTENESWRMVSSLNGKKMNKWQLKEYPQHMNNRGNGRTEKTQKPNTKGSN